MATAAIGHNRPSDPFELFAEHINGLLDEAGNWLNGEGVKSEADAEGVSRLLTMLRTAAKDADKARAEEKRPHDEAAKAVQAKWKPLLDRAELAVSTAKKALAPWLEAREAEQRAAAEAARVEAEEKAAAARKAAQEAAQSDLAAQARIQEMQDEAAAAAKDAAKLDKAKAQAKGGSRAVTLRDVYTPVLVTPKDALRHYMEKQPDALKAWLLDQAHKDVRAGSRSIPGFDIKHERVAQ